jgi:hypothetical protein
MAVSVPAGFLVINTEPIDGRMIAANAAARKNTTRYTPFNSFRGLLVYQQDTDQLYSLIDPSNTGTDAGWQLLSDGSTGSSAAGANTQIQFNNSGDFGGSARLTLDASTGATTVSGSLTIEGAADGLFLIKKGTEEVAKVNQDGVFILTPKATLPTAVQGGLVIDTNGDFYVGV